MVRSHVRVRSWRSHGNVIGMTDPTSVTWIAGNMAVQALLGSRPHEQEIMYMQVQASQRGRREIKGRS